jgi:hypothetical protein
VAPEEERKDEMVNVINCPRCDLQMTDTELQYHLEVHMIEDRS